MKISGRFFSVVAVLGLLVDSMPATAEDFKEQDRPEKLTLGVMTGMGIVDGMGGLGLYTVDGFRIVDHGFVNEISNQVFAELGLGTQFFGDGIVSSVMYSAHFRWDFHRDSEWTYFALGGLSGASAEVRAGKDDDSRTRWNLAPRFGIGLFRTINESIRIRAEISHDLLVGGVSFAW